jgi:hypothetical protein
VGSKDEMVHFNQKSGALARKVFVEKGELFDVGRCPVKSVEHNGMLAHPGSKISITHVQLSLSANAAHGNSSSALYLPS